MPARRPTARATLSAEVPVPRAAPPAAEGTSWMPRLQVTAAPVSHPPPHENGSAGPGHTQHTALDRFKAGVADDTARERTR